MAADFGGGLGAVIGANMADNHLDNALASVQGTNQQFKNTSNAYNKFGKSFLDPASAAIGDVQDKAQSTLGYNEFMAGYTNTPAAQYQLQQANAVQNDSAAARGQVLSGSNLRALSTIGTGIVAQNANQAYEEYLKGSSTQFGQLEQALGNMFSAIGVGQTATGQQASLDAAQMKATTDIAGMQAKNDQYKGSGFGSMFGGLTGGAFAF